jgi:hypothetical protein
MLIGNISLRGLLVAIVSFFIGDSLRSADFDTVHVVGGDWFLVFPAPCRLSVGAFVDYRLAIEILALECDGAQIKPELVEGSIHFNRAKYKDVENAVVYSEHWSEVKSAIWKGGEPFEAAITVFDVPKTARVLRVTYRVHYPNGEISKEYVIVSRDVLMLEKKE